MGERRSRKPVSDGLYRRVRHRWPWRIYTPQFRNFAHQILLERKELLLDTEQHAGKWAVHAKGTTQRVSSSARFGSGGARP
ncbi:MAG: hypothetical protein ACREYE_12500 [Gammaproteobacteria bacterium]